MQGVQRAWGRVRDHRVLGRVVGLRPVAVVLAVVAAVLLTAVTAGSTGERPGSVVYGNLDAQDVRLSIPATDHPKGVAVWFHGQTGGVDNRMDEPWLQSLVRSGWIVASSDFHTASWGNEASTTDTELLIDWAEKQTGEPVRLFVSGSMGATVSLNAMTHGVAAPACWYGVKPAIDVTKMDNVPGADRIISDAFAGEPVPSDRNPATSMSKLPLDTRYRMVASYGDPWVVRDENTDKLMRNIENRGGQVSVLTVTGIHDDPSHFDNNDLVDFADTCAQGAQSASSQAAGD
jgi:hypothetical protein